MKEMHTDRAAEFFIGLSSTKPNKDGSGVTEPSVSDYSRVPLGVLSDPVDGMVSNLSDIVFSESTDVWFDGDNPALYYVIFDGAGEDARYLSAAELVPSRVVSDGITIKIIAHSLRISLNDVIESSVD